MSSVPLKIKQLDLKESKRPSRDDNAGFKGNMKSTSHMGENWHGKVSGKHKHTFKNGD